MIAALAIAASVTPTKKASAWALSARPLRPQRDRDRDRAGPGGEGQGEREEGDLLRVVPGVPGRQRLVVRLAVGMLVAGVQELPAAERDDRAAGDAQGVDRDAEEAQHIGAAPQGAEHDRERIDADEPGDPQPVRMG